LGVTLLWLGNALRSHNKAGLFAVVCSALFRKAAAAIPNAKELAENNLKNSSLQSFIKARVKNILLILVFFLVCCQIKLLSQTFVRSELPTALSVPWEITYGPDNYLWITELGGNVSRVNPLNGSKQNIYTAPDYFGGSPLENHTACFNPSMGSGTLGLALNPDFLNPANAFIYFVHSYNAGSLAAPQTKFKIKRLAWNHETQTVVEAVDIVSDLPSSFDHLGGRLMIIEQEGIPYLFLTIGDNGISETNSPDCYADQSLNPNVQAQNPVTKNGKIHRFNLDGSVPADNPIAGNSFYTRGHRNPQGLMYNSSMNLIYSVEHGDRTDDEINILYRGMNYGWKYVRGYHTDSNAPGEVDYILNYQPHPQIENDSLVQAFYSWCAVPLSASSNNADWCTVAPSDGIYYGSTAIPQWHNSLLVVTLKDGVDTDMEVYQFKLLHNGQLAPSTSENPNPKKFFGEDQTLNGRLRDICISPDGRTIYLINNGGAPTSKITVYTLDPSSVEPFPLINDNCVSLYPNPSTDFVSIIGLELLKNVSEIKITASNGQSIPVTYQSKSVIDIRTFSAGTYVLSIVHKDGICTRKFVKS
jgi:glucose/arabinose dehydrogenase